jgi:uncharacterized membrane protein
VPTDFPLQFERPGWLLLLALLVPVALIARRHWTAVSPVKAWLSLAFRTVVVTLLAVSLAQPTLVKKGEGLSLVVIADRSQSIPLALRQQSEEFLRRLPETKKPDDRLGTIVVGRQAEILARPERNSIVPGLSHPGDTDATDLAGGVRQALSLLPTDTARRLLLVSDGNENVGNLLEEAATAAAAGIPIDVLPLEYEHPNEVVFEGIRAPARSRVGQTADLRLFLRSQGPARGRVTLKMNGEPIDLAPGEPGEAVELELGAGPTVLPVPVSLDEGGAQRFEASFEPSDPAMDALPENNLASAVTFVSGGGRVLIVDPTGDESGLLAAALRQGGLTVETRPPAELAGGPAFLNGYDAILLANVPRWAVDAEADRSLKAYVHDLGGGLAMLGGDASFGAGGWIDSEVAKALPVKMDPPATRQLVRGALAMIIHSCEIPQGNYWSMKVAEAAIEALSRLDLVGIITFGMGGSQWHFPLQEAGDKTRALAAVKSMVVGDMPDFEGAVGRAYEGLVPSSAGRKHVVIVSDGDPAPPSPQLVQQLIDAKITVSTVLLFGHGSPQDRANMEELARRTGGKFHNVTNPKALPKIFTQEAAVVTRSLIAEGDFRPQVVAGLPGPVRGFGAVPAVRGYVVTVPREGLSQVAISIPAKDAKDPLFAWWNHGIGRSFAFTSDATNRWGSAWTGWSDYRAFWEQAVRWLMRPASPQNLSVRTRVEGETAIVELEAVGEDAGFLNFLRTTSTVLAPDGTARPLGLQQVGPGRYRGEFAASETGSYLVNVSVPSTREGDPSSSVQAAVGIPYAKEFRAVRDNATLLEQVAERTGGRVLRMDEVSLADAFDRTGLAIPRSPKRIWDLLAILAAAIFLVDVAVRRLAFDREEARRLAAAAIGQQTEAGDATVEAWKKARGKAKSPAAAEVPEPIAGGPRIDVGAETRGEGTRTTAKPAAAASERKEERKPDGDEASPTSRLLKAKRRAHGGDDAEGGKTDG